MSNGNTDIAIFFAG